MATKYGKKEFMENIKTLTSPFEQNTEQKALPDKAEQIKEIVARNRELKPQ